MKSKFTLFFSAGLVGCLLFSAAFSGVYAQTYCTPTPAPTNPDYYIESFSTTNGIGNINQTATSMPSNGYADFSSTDSVSVLSGNSFNFSASYGDTYGVKVWVDWNHDGDFDDPGEQVYASSSYESSSAGTITVPLTALTGKTRMRIRIHWLSATGPTSPCNETYNSYYIGETQDYTIHIIPLTPCAGQPTAGAVDTTDTFGVCSGRAFNIADTGFSVGSGLTYQWQQRNPSGTGTWANISGANSGSLSFPNGISSATDYRFIVTCNNSNLADTSNIVTAVMNPPSQCYCIPTTTYTGFYITHFTTTNAVQNVNHASGYSSTGYENYTSTDTIKANAGSTFNIQVQSTPGYATYYDVWADFNQNGDFNDPGEHVATGSYTNSPFNSTVAVPSIITPGYTRLRVRSSWLYSGTTPCNNQYYGDAQDYTLELSYPNDCSTTPLPSPLTIQATIDTVCVSGNENFTFNTNIPIGGLTYQWQKSPNGITMWSNIGAAQLAPSLNNFGVSSTAWYRCRIYCHGSLIFTSNRIKVYVANPMILTTPDSSRCGPGSVNLTATSSSGTVINWYEHPFGGSSLAAGDTFTTPPLVNTDTFWVAASVGNAHTDSVWAGNGTYSDYYPFPFYQYDYSMKTQMLVTASELQSQGLTAGFITGISFKIASAGYGTASPYTDFMVEVGTTTLTDLTTTFVSGLQPVYSNASLTLPSTGLVNFTFNTPVFWDGVSNLIFGTCYDNGTWGNYSGPNLQYTYFPNHTLMTYAYAYQPGLCANPSVGYTYTDNNRPNILVHMKYGCEGPRQPVVAHVYVKPTVNLGPDITQCVDSGASVILNAGTQPAYSHFLWDNNSVGQIRAVNQSGSYHVKVTNQYGCSNSDSINVVLHANPVVNLGDDTTVCVNTPITLNAGNDGTSYFWSTGATTHTITVNTSGTYKVIVSNNQPCTVVDSITVTESGSKPTIDGIWITNNGNHTFTFNALNPQHVIGYEWDFGDGSPHSFAAVPTHTYYNYGNFPIQGTYVVTLKFSSDCGYNVDSTAAHILGINDLGQDNSQVSVYPNPTRGEATIVTQKIKMENVTVYNVLGQKVYEDKADSPFKHTLNLDEFASGVYNIMIKTDQGLVTRKLNLIK